jgi:hypothetical protein
MDPSAGFWSAMGLVAAIAVAIGIFLIAARVFTNVRLRREREMRREEPGSRVIEAHTELKDESPP